MVTLEQWEKAARHHAENAERFRQKLESDLAAARERIAELEKAYKHEIDHSFGLRALLVEVRGCRVVASIGTPSGLINPDTGKFEYVAIPRELWERLG